MSCAFLAEMPARVELRVKLVIQPLNPDGELDCPQIDPMVQDGVCLVWSTMYFIRPHLSVAEVNTIWQYREPPAAIGPVPEKKTCTCCTETQDCSGEVGRPGRAELEWYFAKSTMTCILTVSESSYV